MTRDEIRKRYELRSGRDTAVGTELKRSYYDQAVRNCAAASPSGKAQVELFAGDAE